MVNKESVKSSNILDPAFGPDGNGITWIKYPNADTGFASGITVAPDDKLIIAARSGADFSVVRLNADGTQDKTFGVNGTATGKFAAGNQSVGRSVSVLNNGNILLSGLYEEYVYAPTQLGLALFDDKGNPVRAFGSDGVTVVHPIASTQFKLPEVKKDAKSGSTSNQNGFSLELPDGKLMTLSNHRYSFSDQIGLLMRLDQNGALDTTFGNGNGYVTVQYTAHFTWVGSLIRLNNGTFAIGGGVNKDGENLGMIALYSAVGVPVKTFGSNGFVVFDSLGSKDEIFDLVEMHDENILGIGSTYDGTFNGLLVCLDSTGKFVDTFNGGKPVVTPAPEVPGGIQWLSGTQRPDKKIVVIGSTIGEANSKTVITQYMPNGEPDKNFGDGQGKLDVNLTDGLDMGSSIAVQGRQLVASGTSLPHEGGESPFVFRCLQ
jgi:uncharacterized delta-60 repeat protein